MAKSENLSGRVTLAGAMIGFGALVVVLVILGKGLTAPAHVKFKGKGELAIAHNNARQLALGLSEFESDYGRYPDRSTAQKVIDATGTKINLQGDSSNAYFRQLIAAGMVRSEMPFYAKTPYTKIPDDDYSGSKALVKGEVGYGYIMDGDAAMGTGNPGHAIVVTPLLDGRADGRFDPAPFGKAVVLFVDSSVKQLTIRPSDNLAMIGGGKSLLETGEGTVWGTTVKPVIKPPEK